MPCNYTHHRFGAQVLPELPAEVRRPIQRFRRLYNMGLQGPDFFFYFNPLMTTAVGELGHAFHMRSGQETFLWACKYLNQNPSEAGLAYLYGLLGHYCLDSIFHPFVDAASADGKVGHVEMEVEFDRFLMEKDGKAQPHLQDRTKNLKITRGECVTVSEFFPPATAANVHRSIQNMILCTKLLAHKNRKLVKKVVQKAPPSVSQQMMHEEANPNCAHLNEPLLALYNQGLEKYPSLVAQLTAHIHDGAPLGEDFEPIFG